MKTGKKILWTLLLIPGFGLLGVLTHALLPITPALTGLIAAAMVCVGTAIGSLSVVFSAAAYCGGAALVAALLSPEILPVILWLFGLLLLVTLLINRLLRRKMLPAQTMLYGFVIVFAYGALSFIVLNLIKGDPIRMIVERMAVLASRSQEIMPESMDFLLSYLSVAGVLDNVGLTAPVAELEPQLRATLMAGLDAMMDSSLRLSMLDMLTQQAMHVGFLSTLLPLLVMPKARKYELSALPDVERIRLHPGVTGILLLIVLILSIFTLFSDKAYVVYTALWSLVKFLYAIQGLSVAEWFLKKKRWSAWLRIPVLAVGYFFLSSVLFLLGLIDSIFYFRGDRPRPEDFMKNQPWNGDK